MRFELPPTRILVKDYNQDNKTKGGLILAEPRNRPSRLVTVIDCGRDVEGILSFELFGDDVLLISNYAGIMVQIYGEDALVIEATDVLSKIYL